MSGSIGFSFSEYLPSIMKYVQKWVDFASAYQDIFEQYTSGVVAPLNNQSDIDKMTIADCKNFGLYLGYTIPNYTGYTNTLNYFKRQILSLASRAQTKTTRHGYINDMCVYYYKGDVFPMYLSSASGLIPFEDWWSKSEVTNVVITLDYDQPNTLYFDPYFSDTSNIQVDAGYTFDLYTPIISFINPTQFVNPTLDDTQVLTLDEINQINSLTRNMLIQFRPLLCEASGILTTADTMRAFYNDTQTLRRPTETLYYEPVIDLHYSGQILTTTSYKDIADRHTYAGSQYTISIQSGTIAVTDITSIQLGNGGYTNPTLATTGVQSLVSSFSASDIQVTSGAYSGGISYIQVRRALQTGQFKIAPYSEVAMFNAASGCIFYSYFPTVNFYSEMNNSFNFRLI